ncbi:MAG TPA: transposase [Anaerolineaceae bacterium]|nr:transposase [Anaerolineaceae bacterium]
MKYRRIYQPGGSYFFTVVTDQRRPILASADRVTLFRDCCRRVMAAHPFRINAIVILPDHIHVIWTLPPNDSDYSLRWMVIKRLFTQSLHLGHDSFVEPARRRKGEQPIWQRRFWEHLIRDEDDFIRHVEYIHYNPVKHGLATSPYAWPHSSFRRFVEAGYYPCDWAAGEPFSSASAFVE